MDKKFAEMFSKEPPYIIDGDYFYFNPHYEEMSDDIRNYYEKIVEGKKNSGRWRELWESRTFQREFQSMFDKLNHGTNIKTFGKMYDAINTGVSKINEIFNKIAAENKPVMDISSCNTFGLIPFILKFNPQIPCMATDMEAPFTRIMRSTVSRSLAEHNISLASFDNRDIPIKDNSLDYVTSTFGIVSVAYDNAPLTFWEVAVDRAKPINEVYRILKPGGCYVAIEHYDDWKFDLAKARETFSRKGGRLFGIYSYEEVEEASNKLKVLSMHEQFIAAGFQAEIGEKYPFHKFPAFTLDVKDAFSHLLHIFKIREWTDGERERNKSFPALLPAENTITSYDAEAKEYGIEYADGDIFYVLRKELCKNKMNLCEAVIYSKTI
jgi:SAM-dependent methyltransferase